MKFLKQLFQQYRWPSQSLLLAGLLGLLAMANYQSGPKNNTQVKKLNSVKAKKRLQGPAITETPIEEYNQTDLTLVSDNNTGDPSAENIDDRFESWLLCRSDLTEIFFNVDALSQGQGSVSITYPRRAPEPLKESYSNTQVQEFVKSPTRFSLKLSSPSDLGYTQVEISTEKNDGDSIYQGKIHIQPTVHDHPAVKNGDINCTPITRAKGSSQASL